VQCSTL